MAWYEYTTWKRQGAEITADIQGWLARSPAHRDAAVKAEMRAETQRALEEIIKLVGQITELLKTMDERQDFRLTVIERKLGIPTGTNALAGAPQQESVSEQNKRLIEALLQPTPQAPPPDNGLLAPLGFAPIMNPRTVGGRND